jgi:hypothetical protein
MSLTTSWMPSDLNMILMKIDDNGELQADWDAIEKLTKCFDRGCKSEKAYKAKLFSLVLEHGYDIAMDDVEQDRKQVLFMLCTPAGNA